jgi:hypothetical protein
MNKCSYSYIYFKKEKYPGMSTMYRMHVDQVSTTVDQQLRSTALIRADARNLQALYPNLQTNANANGSSVFTVLPTLPDLLFASPSDDEDDPSGDDGQASDERRSIGRGNQGFVLSPLQKMENQIQMDLVMKALDITWSKDLRKLTGTKALSDSSLKTYAKHYRGLMYFLTLAKDYRSMLILQENAPMHLCPSVDANSIVLYYKWKLLPKDTPLEGTSILSSGSWKDPKNMDQFRAAMVALHKSRGQGGIYQEPCSDCLRKYDGCLGAENFEYRGGCRQHPSNPLLWLTGNPVTSSAVEDCVQELFKLHSGYVARGDSPLTPSELIKLRNRLLSSNSLHDFELWTMIIIACRLFLREEEIASMKCEDIVQDITSVQSNGHVEGIAFKVQGKSDVHPVTLMLWSDPCFPCLCPVNALLSWISLTKIKTGYLFPSFTFLQENIGNAEWNGSVPEFDNVIHYSTFLDRFKKLCKNLLERDGPFGTHTCRKTAYLLGAWGGGGDLELMQAARHKTLANAVKYKKDALFLLDLAKAAGNDLSIGTPVWRALYCENFQLARSVNGNVKNFIGLYDMSIKYTDRLKKKLDRDVSSPLDYAEGSSLSLHDFDRMERNLEDLLKNCPSNEASEIRNIFSKLYALAQSKEFPSVPAQPFISSSENCEQVAPVQGLNSAQSSAVQGQLNSAPSSADSSRPLNINGNGSNEEIIMEKSRKKRKRRGGNMEFVGYKDIGDLKNPLEKLVKILHLFAEAPTNLNVMTEPCRKFYYETLLPVRNCHLNHCNGSNEEFLRRWPKFAHSKFGERKCSGKLEYECGLIKRNLRKDNK